MKYRTQNKFQVLDIDYNLHPEEVYEIKKMELKHLTLVPRSVNAIAMLFLAISKFGETAKHLSNTEKHMESEAQKF